jgi:alpha-tubulin suppressor-like RCC1 family protein
MMAAVKTDGTLWVCGNGTIKGSLGQGTGGLILVSSPIQVGSLTTWSQVTVAGAGDYTVFAIKTDGTLWTWGANVSGLQGLGDAIQRSSPVQVGSLTNWASISAGASAAALKTDGTLWAWGANGGGQLGFGNLTALSSPVQVGTDKNWILAVTHSQQLGAIKSDGTLWVCGDNASGQLGTGGVTDKTVLTQLAGSWSDIAFITNNTHGIKTDGTLWGLGH